MRSWMRYIKVKLQNNRFLSEFSTFGIGGPISYFFEAHSVEEMKEALSWAQEKKLPYLILGKGSNSLFQDEGFPGLVILNKIDFLEWNMPYVRVGSGYSFSRLGIQTARKGWSGLEFASGIPASVGGAIFMNAGANGWSASDSLYSVLWLQEDGTVCSFLKEGLSFGYRTSSFQSMKGVIVEATFVLQPLSSARDTQLKILDYRCKTQPLKEKSAGCIFRNPEVYSAGFLIEKVGLKGLQIGGAKVSEIHANFIVNVGNATAHDVKKLIHEIQKRVKQETGIILEPEVRIYENISG